MPALTAPQLRVIDLLTKQGPTDQGTILRAAQVTIGTVRALDRQGLIVHHHTDDHRRYFYALTATDEETAPAGQLRPGDRIMGGGAGTAVLEVRHARREFGRVYVTAHALEARRVVSFSIDAAQPVTLAA